MNFLTSLLNVGLLLAMAVPGYIFKKTKILPENSAKVLIVVLMYIAQPFLTIASFSKKVFEVQLLANMGWTALFSIVFLLLIYFVAKFLFSFSKDEASKRVCVTSSYMNNCAFLGIPVVQAFFPGNGEPLIYCAVFIVVFNIIAWTLSVATISGEKKYISVKKAFLNPPTIALVVALPIFFTKTILPAPLMNTVDFIGNMTSPLSMIMIGIRLADIRIIELFKSVKVYISVFVKLLVAPLVCFGFLMLFRLMYPLDSMVISTLFIIMAMPTAATVVMFSEIYDADSETAVKCSLLSTILCVFTIPLLMLLLTFV